MPQQTEARYVGAGMHAEADHYIPGGFVERRHQLNGALHGLAAAHIGLCRRGEYAYAQGLGKHEHVALPGTAVCQHPVGMHEAGHGKAVFGLLVEYAVTAGYERARLIDLFVASAEQLMHRLVRHAFGHGHDVQAQAGLPAHCVYVRESVGRGNLTEGIGVVRDGRKEIHGLYQRQLVADPVYGRVVAFVKAHEQVRVSVYLEAFKELCQYSGAHLGSAACAVCKLCQFDIAFAHVDSSHG